MRQPSWTIRPAEPSDVEQLAAIEASTPWPRWGRDAFANELDLPWSRTEVVQLLDCGDAARGPHGAGDIIAFMVYWVVADEVQLLNIATSRACLRLGIATALVERLIDRARQAGACRVTLEVRQHNGAAQALYRKLGFHQAGVRARYYSEPEEDAVLLERMI